MKIIIPFFLCCFALLSCKNSPKTNSKEDNLAKINPDAPYKVLKKIKIPGDGSWDYAAFDTVNRRLFISHGTKVDVLDVDKEQVVGEIANTPGVHGIAFAYELNKGYTSNGKDSSVTIFDLKTLKIINKIKTNGANPDAILYDPFTKKLFIFNGKSNDVTTIDPETGTITGSLALGGKPEFSVTNEFGKVYVNIEDQDEIIELNAKTLTINNISKLDSGKEPTGLAYDITYRKLYVGCGNQMLEIKNAGNGLKTATRPIGSGVDAVAFNPETKVIFSSNGDGTLSIIKQEDAEHYKSPETIQTQKGAKTMAIDVKHNRIYLPVADFGPMAPAEPGKKQKPSIVPGTFSVLVVGQ